MLYMYQSYKHSHTLLHLAIFKGINYYGEQGIEHTIFKTEESKGTSLTKDYFIVCMQCWKATVLLHDETIAGDAAFLKPFV